MTSPFVLMLIGSILTLILVAVSFLITTMFDDKGKGMAAAISFWQPGLGLARFRNKDF